MKISLFVPTIEKLREMKKNQKLFFTFESVDYLVGEGKAGKGRGLFYMKGR